MNDVLNELYAPIEPYNSAFLQVDDIHTIYYEQCGHRTGIPVLVCHGGPGGGIATYYRRFFNPNLYRIILIDQRGAGLSKPAAELKQNTTWHLVSDMELVRLKLGIESWLLFGGSWGSTLCLCYALKHREHVKGLILRGIFTLRRSELQWFYQNGASHIFAEAFNAFKSVIPEAERGDLISAFHRHLIASGTDDETVKDKIKVARAWSVYEMTTSRLYVDKNYIARALNDNDFAMKFATIETHYFVHGGWFDYDGFLIKNVHHLHEIPAVIVQGRYDVVCPTTTAWELSLNWSTAQLQIVDDAGHSAKEPGIIDRLVHATNTFAAKNRLF